MAEQVQQAVDEQQAALVGLGGPEGRGLPGDVGGREHDVTELAGLAGGEGRVVGSLALERDHVRRAVDPAPLGVELADAPLPHERDGHHAGATGALLLEHAVADGGDLLVAERAGDALLADDVVLVLCHDCPLSPASRS